MASGEGSLERLEREKVEIRDIGVEEMEDWGELRVQRLRIGSFYTIKFYGVSS